MLINLFGIGWMLELLELGLCVYQIDRKICCNGVKWLVICPFEPYAVSCFCSNAWKVVVESLNVGGYLVCNWVNNGTL